MLQAGDRKLPALDCLELDEDEAFRVVEFEELEEGVEDAANLADVVPRCAFATERVELVEQVDSPGLLYRVEHKTQLRGGLAHELRDEPVELDGEQRQPELPGQDRPRHRLPRSRRPKKQQATDRVEAVLADPGALPLLDQHSLDSLTNLPVERHVAEAELRIPDAEEAGEFASWLGQGDGLGRRRWGLGSLPGLVDQIAQFLRKLHVPALGCLGGDLQSNRQEAGVVPVRVALDERLCLVGCGHVVLDFDPSGKCLGSRQTLPRLCTHVRTPRKPPVTPSAGG